MTSIENLTYDVFVNDPPPQDNGLLPNGEPKLFSPQASTLILGREDAVLTDPGMTRDQARAAQSRIRAAMKRGLQTRDAEMELDRILSEPAHH
jgi:hypothetical protein